MRFLLIIISLILCAGCQQKPQVRHYTEIRIEPRVAHLVWNLPSGWVDDGATAMRLASLHLEADPSAFECSIVSLPGAAGGVHANLKRWMNQLHLEVSDQQLAGLMSSAKDHIYDFTQLQAGQKASTPSMIAAILNVEGNTVFVKLTGSIESVRKNEAAFAALVRSVHLNE